MSNSLTLVSLRSDKRLVPEILHFSQLFPLFLVKMSVTRESEIPYPNLPCQWQMEGATRDIFQKLQGSLLKQFMLDCQPFFNTSLTFERWVAVCRSHNINTILSPAKRKILYIGSLSNFFSLSSVWGFLRAKYCVVQTANSRLNWYLLFMAGCVSTKNV